MRNGFVEERTALVNRLRGELVEFGVFLPQGIDAFRAHFIESLEEGTTI
jgi:transposase